MSPHPLLQSTLAQLEALGSERVRTLNHRNGAGTNQYGVMLGDIRKVAAKFKNDHALGLALWDTGNLDARLVGILLMKPAALGTDDLDRMVRSAGSAQEADWLSSYITKKHPQKETLRVRWMQDADPWAARAGWSLTAERIAKNPEGLDLEGLLHRIEAELAGASPTVQWTMNFGLAHIGIHVPALRARALEIGERLGVYRDYPCAKGCTSPFAPIWINEMVKRQA